ncbi:NYN domain-containing protein [Staphylococcus hominis]|uniref:NYN domain-containing protein n=1 Tax=Staphylococcus hominis TaxID=1290 RepID=UPI001F599F7B|nr:NYN domain-containing protein [Staphylococcus hominis]MCI2863317.1 NYN domain-containing protein [Staphylococcus hominis]MCI2867689.1 NYN domain-containing protein [Staphylococcus hominis]MCI2885142.1 NYN domain-containing protein [Staphylococcus hominis]
MKDRYLIIDGYNMIGQSRELSKVARESLEEAREQLLDVIANYNAVVADEIVCVFDAYEQSGIEREYMYHGVKTVFTKEKETADSYIERYVYNLYNKHTTHITVVTSDMSEQHAIFGVGAYRVSSREMWRDLKENAMTVSKSVDDFNERKPRTRISLSKDVLAEFEKIRRGYGKKHK